MPKLFPAGRFALFALVTVLVARADLSQDQIKLLQDPGGWEYIKMGDADQGVQTEHVCFDGKPHPEACSGKLNLTTDNKFSQTVFIHGESAERHGTYQIDGDQLAFFDEFGTRDGPYTIEIDVDKKLMVMHMPQVRVELELEKEYRKSSQPKQ